MLKVLPTITMRYMLEEFPPVTFWDLNEFLEAVKPDDIKEKKPR